MSTPPTLGTAPTATLTVIPGRPNTGKTTLARALANHRRSCYLTVIGEEHV